YRTTKGKENEAVQCSFFFHTRNLNPQSNDRDAYLDARKKLQAAERPTEADLDKLFPGGLPQEQRGRLLRGELSPDEVENLLAERFGYFEVQGVAVADYHTLHIDVPGGLFKNALGRPGGGGEA